MHDRFDEWLDQGGAMELPRDVAVHAWSCDRCLLHATAIDRLVTIDVEAAPIPPMDDAWTPRPQRGITPQHIGVGASAAGALFVAAVVAVNVLQGSSLPVSADATSTAISEGVLGDAAGPPGASLRIASDSPTPTPSPGLPDASPTDPAPHLPAQAPSPVRSLQPQATPAVTATPQRSAVPTPIAPARSPTPTPSPSPSPSVAPTLIPTPSPQPSMSESPSEAAPVPSP